MNFVLVLEWFPSGSRVVIPNFAVVIPNFAVVIPNFAVVPDLPEIRSNLIKTTKIHPDPDFTLWSPVHIFWRYREAIALNSRLQHHEVYIFGQIFETRQSILYSLHSNEMFDAHYNILKLSLVASRDGRSAAHSGSQGTRWTSEAKVEEWQCRLYSSFSRSWASEESKFGRQELGIYISNRDSS